MNKEQYLKNLRRRIRSLPPDELERILAYYREMIEDKVEGGESERDAVADLGDVQYLSRKILSENPNRRPKNVGKTVAVSVLSLFGVVLVACIALSCLEVRHMGGGGPSAAGIGSFGAFTYKTYTVRPDGIGTVKIDAEEKMIVFEPSDQDRISVEYADSPSQQYGFSSAGGTFTVENRESAKWGGRWGNDDSNVPRITVRLPGAYSGNVQVKAENSHVRVSDFKKLNELKCNTTNSAIDLSSLDAQNMELETQNAAIMLNDVSAASRLSADTQNAVIALEGIRSPDITLNTINAMINGSITGRQEDYSVDAQTTNAVSNLQNRSGGGKKLSVRTTNAIIHIDFKG